MQSPLGYQGNTAQAQGLVWAELFLVLFPLHMPLPKSTWSDFSRSMQIDSHCCQRVFLFWFLLSPSDSTSSYSFKEPGLIFFCVIRNVLGFVHFENCRKRIPALSASPRLVLVPNKHRLDPPEVLPRVLWAGELQGWGWLPPGGAPSSSRSQTAPQLQDPCQHHPKHHSCWTEVQTKGCITQSSLSKAAV